MGDADREAFLDILSRRQQEVQPAVSCLLSHGQPLPHRYRDARRQPVKRHETTERGLHPDLQQKAQASGTRLSGQIQGDHCREREPSSRALQIRRPEPCSSRDGQAPSGMEVEQLERCFAAGLRPSAMTDG